MKSSEWLERLTSSAKVVTVLDLIPASFDNKKSCFINFYQVFEFSSVTLIMVETTTCLFVSAGLLIKLSVEVLHFLTPNYYVISLKPVKEMASKYLLKNDWL